MRRRWQRLLAMRSSPPDCPGSGQTAASRRSDSHDALPNQPKVARIGRRRRMCMQGMQVQQLSHGKIDVLRGGKRNVGPFTVRITCRRTRVDAYAIVCDGERPLPRNADVNHYHLARAHGEFYVRLVICRDCYESHVASAS